MSSRDDVPTIEDELAAITLEDQDSEPTAPPESAAPESPEPADEGSAESQETPAEPDAQAPEAEPEAPAPTWQPPEGGQPFAFRADGREVEVPGALRYEHGVYVPTEALPVLQRHLADREALNHRYNTLQRQYEERDPEKHPDVIRARATTQNFLELLKQGPEKVAEWLDDFQRNAPLIQAKIEADTLRSQLEARQSQWQEQLHEQRAREIADALPSYLKQHIDYLLTNAPDLKDLAGQSDELLHKLWSMHDYLFVEAVDRDMPEYGLKQGQIGVRQDRLAALLKERADQAREFKRLQEAAKLNAKATGKAPVTPTISTRGRPTPGGRSKTYKAGDYSEFKDDFMRWDPEKDD